MSKHLTSVDNILRYLKNIVKLLLENYGFDVIDLGRDVAPEAIAQAVESENALICGLSALMTTTVPAMEETITFKDGKTYFNDDYRDVMIKIG